MQPQAEQQRSVQPTRGEQHHLVDPSRPARRDRSSTAARRRSTLTHVTPRPLDPPQEARSRESIHWKRKLFHVLGVGAAGFTYALSEVSPAQGFTILAVITVIFVTVDTLRTFVPSLNKRIRKDFEILMRDYELEGISGSSWFFISALLAIGLFPKMAAALGLIYLAVGDPVASAVGVKWGRTRLPGGKSLEGSLAMFAVCAPIGFVILVAMGAPSLALAAVIATGAALAAAVAEWLPLKRVDDNFTVPLLTAAATAALLSALL